MTAAPVPSAPVPAASRDLDVVLFGATGFVGRLTAEHLAKHAPSGVRIGLAGRSADKLAALRRELGPAAAGWPPPAGPAERSWSGPAGRSRRASWALLGGRLPPAGQHGARGRL